MNRINLYLFNANLKIYHLDFNYLNLETVSLFYYIILFGIHTSYEAKLLYPYICLEKKIDCYFRYCFIL